MWTPTVHLALLSGLLAPLLISQPMGPATTSVELLSIECETDLALSAAPEHLRDDASLYILEDAGYRLLREGTNGFTCIVNRDHPRVLKPTCFDAEGSATIVPKILYFGEALMQGKSVEDISAEVKHHFDQGHFRSPSRPGVAYMLSRYNRPYNATTDQLGWFPPHLMFYAPNLTGEDIGFGMEAWHENASLPFIGYQGPQGYMIVITDDGTPRAESDLRSCPAWVHADG